MKLLVIILSLIGLLYSVVLNLYKRRSAENPIPESVNDVYDEETYTKWRAYNAAHSKLDLLSSLVVGVLNLILLATNVYSGFASLFPDELVPQTLAVIILDVFVSTIVGIIFSYYATFTIEEKFGFNKSTKVTFVKDKIRDFIISLVLSLAICFLLSGLHNWLGDYLIILFTVVMFLFSLLITFLYPLLSRIGNKFEPLEEGELRTSLMTLLTSHGYKVRDIKVMDASRRTTKLNAYFTGIGSSKTIVLYDNLVNVMTPDEICAVFAHELGHGLNKDVPKLQVINIGNFLLMAVAAWIAVCNFGLHEAFGFGAINYGFAYILIGIFLSLIQPLTSIIINALSRKFEYRADRQAVKEGYGEAMIGALKKLARENFAELAPTRVSVLLEYSHPPLADRISAVQAELSKKED